MNGSIQFQTHFTAVIHPFDQVNEFGSKTDIEFQWGGCILRVCGYSLGKFPLINLHFIHSTQRIEHTKTTKHFAFQMKCKQLSNNKMRESRYQICSCIRLIVALKLSFIRRAPNRKVKRAIQIITKRSFSFIELCLWCSRYWFRIQWVCFFQTCSP